jgi:methanogenic corrinoid protein MtbC1
MLRNGSSDDTSRTNRPGSPAPDGSIDSAGLAADRDMSSLIQDEIIPRLLAAHRLEETELRPNVGLPPRVGGRMDPDAVADQAIVCEAGGLLQMFEVAIAQGADVETLLLDVLAPAARCLGTRWEEDTADFIDVTMGLWRLQEVVHELTGRNAGQEVAVSNGRRIMCAVAPGDDHSFGSVILEEFFRRAGWNAQGGRSSSRSELLSSMLSEWFDVVALTVTVEQPSGTLADLVAAMRAASRNPAVQIMVGGRIFSEQPGLADAVGADATASDARGALSKAERLIGQLQVGDGFARMAGASLGHQPQRRGPVPG